MGDYIGDYYRVIKGDTRSLDYGSYLYTSLLSENILSCRP